MAKSAWPGVGAVAASGLLGACGFASGLKG